MAERVWIRDLRPGDDLQESFVIKSRDLRQRRGGGQYLAAVIGDRTGEVTALAWERVDRLAEVCEPGEVVRIGGQIQKYQGRTQVIIRRAEKLPSEEIDLRNYVRSAATDAKVLWSTFQDIISEVEEPRLKQLLYRVFSDPEVERGFRSAPAAKTMHHAYRSGLLEHTVSAMQAARPLASHYKLNEDLVLAGVALHDLGKVWELCIGNTIEYTDDGRLLGHLSLEVLHVDRIISEIDGFPSELRKHLLHILLSHHGEYAYGSPRRPKTPEAMLVHLVDNMDSRMAGMFEAINADGDSDEAWSSLSKMLERNIYRRRP